MPNTTWRANPQRHSRPRREVLWGPKTKANTGPGDTPDGDISKVQSTLAARFVLMRFLTGVEGGDETKSRARREIVVPRGRFSHDTRARHGAFDSIDLP